MRPTRIFEQVQAKETTLIFGNGARSLNRSWTGSVDEFEPLVPPTDASNRQTVTVPASTRANRRLKRRTATAARSGLSFEA